MRVLIPLLDEAQDLGLHLLQAGEAWRHQALALDDGEPLLHLVHPRAVHGREVEMEPGVPSQPGPDLFAAVRAHVIADDMDDRDRGWGLPVDLLEELDDLGLALATPT